MDYPKIDPRYLTTKEDVEDLRSAYRLTDEIIRQPAFDKYLGDPLNTTHVDITSDAFPRNPRFRFIKQKLL